MKCATITPDEARVKEFGLKQMWRSPNGTIRNILDGTIFREPIICRNVPRVVQHWDKPVVVARRSGLAIELRRTSDSRRRHSPAQLDSRGRRKPDRARGDQDERRRHRDGHVQLDSSIEGFARGLLPRHALGRNYPVYLSTKNTILKAYDGRFKDTFQRVFDADFKAAFEAKGLTYEHRLIDDMVAANLKWSGGYLWACKNYDGDVSPTRSLRDTAHWG